MEQVLEKNFPLRRHKYALKAAMAALVADQYGNFWKFHDQLFVEYDNLSDQKIRAIAKNLGFNSEEFEKMMNNPKILAKINQDILDGRQAGVTGVPTVFVNGRRLRDWSLNGLQILIDKELEKK